MKRSSALLLLILCFWGALSVDRKNFRTCADTPFCQRLRSKSGKGFAEPQDYHLDFSSVKINQESSHVTGDMLNGRHPKQHPLKWRLSILKDGIVHMAVREENPKYPRWEVPDVIQESARVPLGSSEVAWTRKDSEGSVHGKFGASEILITSKPFSVVVSVKSEKAIVINGHNLFNFEQYRDKNPKPTDGSEITNPKDLEFSYDSDGMWEHAWKIHTDTMPRGPSAIGMDISFVGADHIYGLPEHASAFALKSTRGGSGAYSEPFRLWNLDVFEYELDEPMALYGAVPLVLTHDASKTIGALWLNSAETYVDIWDSRDHSQKGEGQGGYLSNLIEDTLKPLVGAGGKPVKNAHWMSESGIVDTFLMLGPTPADFFRQYMSLTGFMDLPQRFATGYHQCRWNYKNELDVAQVDGGFDEHDIPYDVLWLDIEHTDGKRYFTWDSGTFPTPEKMQEKLAAKARRLVTIVDPHIKRDANYHVHKDAEEKKLYIKNKDGGDFEGWCWPGSASYLDFLDENIRKHWADYFSFEKYQGSTPILFIWNDMNEPSVFNGPEVTMPKDALHLGGTVEHRDVHNLYGYYHHTATAQGLIQRDNGRPFVLTRSFFAGSQRTASVWTGDNTASWDHLDYATPMLLSLGVSGIQFSGADVGGFFGDPDAELLLRWYQAAAFQPFYRGHAHIDTKRREPWLFGEEYTVMIRAAIRQRYAILPYVYTVFHQSSVSGAPVLRPLWAEFPTDAETFANQDSFMMGDAFLVKPVTKAKQASTKVYLPGAASVWYAQDSWKSYKGGASYTVSSPLSYTPVFQRGGSIVAKQERARRNSELMVKDPYTLVVALDPATTAAGYLYIDDGKSFKYRQGAYILRKFVFEDNILSSKAASAKDAGTSSLGAVAPVTGAYESSCKVERIVIAGFEKEPKQILLSAAGVSATELEFRKDSSGLLVVRKPSVLISSDWSVRFVF